MMSCLCICCMNAYLIAPVVWPGIHVHACKDVGLSSCPLPYDAELWKSPQNWRNALWAAQVPLRRWSACATAVLLFIFWMSRVYEKRMLLFSQSSHRIFYTILLSFSIHDNVSSLFRDPFIIMMLMILRNKIWLSCEKEKEIFSSLCLAVKRRRHRRYGKLK